VSQYMPGRSFRSFLINLSNRINVIMLRLLRGSRTSPADQMIRYPPKAGFSSYTFSIWAFDEDRYPAILRGYYEFCRRYYDEHGYRCDMLNVGYRISEDRNQLFSYTWDGNVMTLDPVSTGQAGWDEFLVAYNDFCSDAGGIPLFNQTKHITPAQAYRAFGNRLATFDVYRRRYDPTDRLLNEYFRTVLSPDRD
jgi:FAD/FMN-containing dehydrogenase